MQIVRTEEVLKNTVSEEVLKIPVSDLEIAFDGASEGISNLKPVIEALDASTLFQNRFIICWMSAKTSTQVNYICYSVLASSLSSSIVLSSSCVPVNRFLILMLTFCCFSSGLSSGLPYLYSNNNLR